MSETKYLPGDWLDEEVPETGDHPDAFLICEDGVWSLRPIEDGAVRDQPTFWQALKIGDIVVFCEHRDFGFWTVTIAEDQNGKVTFTGGETIPAEANCFWSDAMPDDMGETLQDLVDFIRMEDPGFCGDVSVQAYVWTDGEPWRLERADGKIGFVKEATHGLH